MTKDTRSKTLGHAAKSTPMLTAEDERALFAAYRTGRDHRARHKIAMAHLRLVIGEANRFARSNIPAEDLITEGNIAIMQAMDSFDPDRGVRFCAYARHWVRTAIMACVIKNRSVVSISGTKANKRLFFQLERTKDALKAAHGGHLPPHWVSLVASALGVTERAVAEMTSRLEGDKSADAPTGEETDTAFIDTKASPDDDPETMLMKADTKAVALAALSELSERERHILTARIYTDAETVPELSDLAKIFGVTPQRIHQIEKQALAKLREAVLAKTSLPA